MNRLKKYANAPNSVLAKKQKIHETALTLLKNDSARSTPGDGETIEQTGEAMESFDDHLQQSALISAVRTSSENTVPLVPLSTGHSSVGRAVLIRPSSRAMPTDIITVGVLRALRTTGGLEVVHTGMSRWK